jgi:hypothetical protein
MEKTACSLPCATVLACQACAVILGTSFPLAPNGFLGAVRPSPGRPALGRHLQIDSGAGTIWYPCPIAHTQTHKQTGRRGFMWTGEHVQLND